MELLDKITMPVKFRKLYKEYRDKHFHLLDIGCGNHSSKITKKYFGKVSYWGIDKEDYNIDHDDILLMDKYIKIDLASQKLVTIPDNFFDVVILSHIIEHLPNGLDVLLELTEKIKVGGKIYVEFPSIKSLSLPSIKGTLHFCDDPSHVRLYGIKEICNLLLSRKFKIIKAGARRDLIRICFLPAFILARIMKGTYDASVFWDISGFASYVYAEKNVTL